MNVYVSKYLINRFNFPLTSMVSFFLFFSLSASAQLAIGEKAPDIILRDVNGKVKRLSDLKGKVVLVDFWASWCGPCRRANPSLILLYNKYKKSGFEIYGVSIDDEPDAWKKAIEKDKLSWSNVIETGGWEGRVATNWKVDIVPTSYLLDRSGKIIVVDPFGKQLERALAKQLNVKR